MTDEQVEKKDDTPVENAEKQELPAATEEKAEEKAEEKKSDIKLLMLDQVKLLKKVLLK